MEKLVMFGGYYEGKRVFVTGHTGFKGSWLSLWLNELGAQVSGFSIDVPTCPSMFENLGEDLFENDLRGDVGDFSEIKAAVETCNPDIIFHMAAQPIVRRSYREPLETLQTNAMGTAHVLEAVRLLKLPAHVVVVTSDKCYENRGTDEGYEEGDLLGGHDVYSASKGAAEIVAHSWLRSFFWTDENLGNVATARAGNVIGGGDYASDRLLPDCVNHLQKKEPIVVRNPSATRPWQHVLDCLCGYLSLGALLATSGKNSEYASAFNFGPGRESNRSVRDLVEAILRVWPGEWRHLDEEAPPHEATLLHLSTEKAKGSMDWHPVWDFDEAVEKTVEWYRHRHLEEKNDMVDFSRKQLADFVAKGQLDA